MPRTPSSAEPSTCFKVRIVKINESFRVKYLVAFDNGNASSVFAEIYADTNLR